MITASLTELLADRGYGVTGVVSSDRGRKLIETRPIALVVLAARADAADLELVRSARQRCVPTILVSLSPGSPDKLTVDGQHVIGVSNGALLATVQATIGGPADSDPVDPTPSAA